MTSNPPPINTVTVGYPTFVSDIPKDEVTTGQPINLPGTAQQGIPVNPNVNYNPYVPNTNYNPYNPNPNPYNAANQAGPYANPMGQTNPIVQPNPMAQPSPMPQQNRAQPQAGGRQVEVIVVEDPLLINPILSGPMLGDFPTKFHCPTCNTSQISVVNHVMGAGSWCWFCLWCFCFPPASFLSCCCPPLQDAVHSCPNCGRVVGIKPAMF